MSAYRWPWRSGVCGCMQTDVERQGRYMTEVYLKREGGAALTAKSAEAVWRG